jgi:hypothetical protein
MPGKGCDAMGVEGRGDCVWGAVKEGEGSKVTVYGKYELRVTRFGTPCWNPSFFGNLAKMSLIFSFHLNKISKFDV